MKLYLKVMLFLILAVLVFGVTAPELISSADTLSVVMGMVLIVVILPVEFIIGKSVYINIKEKL